MDSTLCTGPTWGETGQSQAAFFTTTAVMPWSSFVRSRLHDNREGYGYRAGHGLGASVTVTGAVGETLNGCRYG